ncbi:hypothetical protein CEXT_43311 [Caerostris extrusa]|uniref:Uncharacterized protein n=1 Tax=Caerostris extrusa TaxID=172846 RepID=A0AAV4TMZ7_CAEEX|nr:hypothetical protein CEXT_43311 [Caerostris extrusa]
MMSLAPFAVFPSMRDSIHQLLTIVYKISIEAQAHFGHFELTWVGVCNHTNIGRHHDKKSPESLYELCTEATTNCLRIKYWNGEATNPFSQINCNIVNDLFESLIFRARVKVTTPLKLLLKSGQLQKLNFEGIDFTEKQWKYIMEILLKKNNRCRNITHISLPKTLRMKPT